MVFKPPFCIEKKNRNFIAFWKWCTLNHTVQYILNHTTNTLTALDWACLVQWNQWKSPKSANLTQLALQPGSIKCSKCLTENKYHLNQGLVCMILTSLQLGVDLTQAPVHAVVTVGLLKQIIQHVPDRLSLVHHQCLGAAITHHHLHYQLPGGTYK